MPVTPDPPTGTSAVEAVAGGAAGVGAGGFAAGASEPFFVDCPKEERGTVFFSGGFGAGFSITGFGSSIFGFGSSIRGAAFGAGLAAGSLPAMGANWMFTVEARCGGVAWSAP